MSDSAIYVVVGSNGLIKVGMSANPSKRIQSLKRDFKLMGNEVIDFYQSEAFGTSWQAERELIDFSKNYPGASVVFGREYFQGIDASVCIEKAKALETLGMEEMRRAERRRNEIREADRVAAEKRAATKEKKMQALKDAHFAEFIELQKSGQIPIPEVTTKEPK